MMNDPAVAQRRIRVARPGAMLASLFVCAFALGLTAAQANPGELDIKLNWGGRNFLPDSQGAIVRAMNIPRTGRTLLLVAGDSARVERRELDGRMDATYGYQGRAWVPSGRLLDATSDALGQVHVLSERVAQDGSGVVEITRIDPSGRVDIEFGEGGIARIPAEVMRRGQMRARSIAMAHPGTLLVALQPDDPRSGRQPVLARFNPEGIFMDSLELPVFEKPAIGAPPLKALVGLATLPDGGFFVGSRTGVANGHTLVHKFLPSGQLDFLWGGVGMTRLDSFDATAMAVSSAGEIVLGASLSDPTDPNLGATAIARIPAKWTGATLPGRDGWVERPIGRAGILVLPRGDRRLRSVTTDFVAFDPSAPDRVIVGGHTWSPAKGKTGWSPLIERLDANGRLDPTFGANGAVELDLGYTADVVHSLALGDSASGYRLTVAGSGDGRPALAGILGGSRDQASGPLPLFVTNSASNTTRVAAGAYVTLYFPEIPVPEGCQDLINCERLEISVEYELPRKPASRVVSARPIAFSQTQANLVVPASVAGSPSALLRIIDKQMKRIIAEKLFTVDPVAPALFTRNNSGLGTPSGYFLRVTGGKQSSELVSGNAFSLTDADDVYLILFGTGIRGGNRVTATLRHPAYPADEGLPVEVVYAGPQGDGALDQVNLRMPIQALRAAGARGQHSVVLEVSAAGLDRKTTIRSNPVEIAIDF